MTSPTGHQSVLPLDVPQGRGLDSSDGNLETAFGLGMFGPGLTDAVRRIVRGELYRSRFSQPEDVEDVCSDCMVALLGRLEDFRMNPEAAQQIEDPDAYVAVIARRACSAWARRKHPGFHRQRTRLRYLLLHEKRFALWQDAQQGGRGEWLCGWAFWRTDAHKPQALTLDVSEGLSPGEVPAQILKQIFDRAGHPLFFNDLVRICAQVWPVNDVPRTIASLEEVPGPERHCDAAIHRQTRLKLVWEQICLLPARQRMALLLNMTGPDGECGTSLLVVTGTVSPREMAGVIGIEAEEFAELLVRLPLSDLEIGGRMQISRQQVINLRKCARERLRRRMGEE